MIDLHLHLDGSLPPALLFKLAKAEGVVLPGRTEEELTPFLTAPKDCQSLNEYLEKFSLPVSCMQSSFTLKEAAKGLAHALAGQGLIYAEIRFAPQLHQQKGLTQKQAVEAVLGGLDQAKEEGSLLKTNLILCCMRGADNGEANRETVRLAAEFLEAKASGIAKISKASGGFGTEDGSGAFGAKVCAVDLAGAEALFPTEGFAELFSLTRRLGVPFTIHAGEAAGAESIEAALRFGAKRLGHGVRVMENPKLMAEIIERKIPLELCMTSNLQTKALPKDEPYPLLDLLRRGAMVTVNTDNMTVSGTTIAREFAALRAMGMTAREEKTLLLHSAEAAFLSASEKEKLREEIENLE